MLLLSFLSPSPASIYENLNIFSFFSFFLFRSISQKAFDLLVNAMMCNDLAMKAVLNNAELLVFTSSVLPMRYWSKATNELFIIFSLLIQSWYIKYWGRHVLIDFEFSFH